MDNEQPRQELVKCVVVGDTAVGKTRLICARACNKQFSLSQLLNTHVPTVWAIDQYRIYKEVLERSWVSVDGVNVSLRLWDTFGDHDKDRRFAYGRSDVVVLCFSVANAASLRNCLVMWYPEIRKFCPNTPVLLVGCKNDLRHIYKDDEYLQFCRERSPLVRATKESDLVMPGEGRAVAREIGIDYYETSVLSFYGITELFDNVVRSALISRRQQRFWMTSLKRVQRPIPQVPFCPPKPKFVNVVVKPSTICEDFHTLYRSGSFSDLVLVAGDTMIYAHQFIVAAASSAFNKLLNTDVEGDLDEENKQEIKGAFYEATSGVFDSDTDHLLAMDPHEETARYLDENPEKSKNGCFYSIENHYKTLNHAAFESISIKKPEKELINEKDPYNSNTIGGDEPPNCPLSVQKVVTLSKLVSSATLLQVVHFMYTGSIFCRMCSVPLPNFSSLRQVARLLELSELEIFLSNLLDTGKFSNDNFGQEYIQVFLCRLSELCLDDNFACDIILRLDDGEIEAHKALLTARCDVMRAMFSGDFRESNARIVSFPGLKVRTFKVILHYLYTDTVPSLSIKECLPAIELANRLCIPRLINLVEREIVDSLNRVLQSGEDVSENCLFLLEPLQMHNADQLVDWCLTYLSTNYNNVCHMFSKQLRSLHPENQAWLNRHRWPPVWYLKDFDFYERCIIERQRENYPLKQLKRTRNPSAGCLCFSSKTRRKSPKQFIHTM